MVVVNSKGACGYMHPQAPQIASAEAERQRAAAAYGGCARQPLAQQVWQGMDPLCRVCIELGNVLAHQGRGDPEGPSGLPLSPPLRG